MMKESTKGTAGRGRLRTAVWSTAAALLLAPYVAMQVSDEIAWDAADFAIFGVMLAGACAVYELAARRVGRSEYRAAIALVLAAVFGLVWIFGAVGSDGGEFQMRIHYLEIVTTDVDGAVAAYAAYAAAHGLEFGEPDPMLGNAQTAELPGGGTVGVRAPMQESEEPVVRPYWLVDDIEAAVAAAVDAGGEVAHPPLEIPGRGTFAIYFMGGSQHGLWQQ